MWLGRSTYARTPTVNLSLMLATKQDCLSVNGGDIFSQMRMALQFARGPHPFSLLPRAGRNRL